MTRHTLFIILIRPYKKELIFLIMSMLPSIGPSFQIRIKFTIKAPIILILIMGILVLSHYFLGVVCLFYDFFEKFQTLKGSFDYIFAARRLHLVWEIEGTFYEDTDYVDFVFDV